MKEKLELALKMMKDREHEVAGLGAPMFIIKYVIDSLPESTEVEDAPSEQDEWISLMKTQIEELEKYEGKLESVKDSPISGSIVLRFEKNSYWMKIEKMSTTTLD